MRVGYLVLAVLMGCASVHQVKYQRLDGSWCEVTKVNPVFFSSETSSDCLVKGQIVQIDTKHEDISILGGLGAIFSLLLGTSL
jgi:hypothetical protein